MKRFAPLLRDINKRLDLPRHVKSRIILEIADDLNELFEHYKSEGLSEKEAEEKVLKNFELDNETVAQLVRIHDTPSRKITGMVPEWMQQFIEWLGLIMLIILIGFFIYFSITLLSNDTSMRIFHDTSEYKWIPVCLFVLVCIITISKLYAIFIKKDYSTKSLHFGINFLLFIACFSVIASITGTLTELYWTSGILENRVWQNPPSSLIFEFAVKSSGLTVFSILVAFLSGLLWLVFAFRAAMIEKREAHYLFNL